MIKTSEHTIHALELDRVLALLSDYAVSGEAKEKCRDICPISDIEDVRLLQQETEDARMLLITKGSPSFADIIAIADSVLRADQGGVLSPVELLRVASVFRVAAALKSYANSESLTSLDAYFNALTVNKYLEERITSSILSEEEIADGASTELSDIRRHKRIQSAKIRESLQKIISSPSFSKYLREPIITIRSDRYVVPVKSEYKNEIPGLVHDVSSSGGTFFIEPMSAVNANNELRELLLKEKKEIERILAELSAEVASRKDQILINYQTLITLDTIFAKAKLSLKMNAVSPELRDDGITELIQARHPLIPSDKIVPITVSIGRDFDALVVTGPNTGGKTVSLKTVGLITLMAECGLQIPAKAGSSVNLFESVYADIGDEQSIEQSLSTFSSHMKTIVEVISLCDKDSLVLFDELGAGTDPAEGAALAIALIQYCLIMGSKVIATTHYAELKMFALRTERVLNASCEFNVETLQPTYRLLIGIPGKSNAFAISKKLGLPEEIISKAGELVNQNDKDFEDLLNQLEQQRLAMERARDEAEQLKRETERLKEKSEEYYQEIKREREKALAQARKDAQYILDDARRTANAATEEIKKLRKEAKEAAGAANYNERQSKIRTDLNDAERRLNGYERPVERAKPTREIREGDTVELLKYGTKATVLTVAKDGTMQLQAGIMRVNAKPSEVYLLENESTAAVKKIIERSAREFHAEAGTPELDLRGMSAAEAVMVLNQFLDNAVMAKRPSARIIHGKGTGVLRKAVHDELKHSRYIKNFRLGTFGEGEDGVTIVEF